jgi:hypothetical protein
MPRQIMGSGEHGFVFKFLRSRWKTLRAGAAQPLFVEDGNSFEYEPLHLAVASYATHFSDEGESYRTAFHTVKTLGYERLLYSHEFAALQLATILTKLRTQGTDLGIMTGAEPFANAIGFNKGLLSVYEPLDSPLPLYATENQNYYATRAVHEEELAESLVAQTRWFDGASKYVPFVSLPQAIVEAVLGREHYQEYLRAFPNATLLVPPDGAFTPLSYNATKGRFGTLQRFRHARGVREISMPLEEPLEELARMPLSSWLLPGHALPPASVAHAPRPPTKAPVPKHEEKRILAASIRAEHKKKSHEKPQPLRVTVRIVQSNAEFETADFFGWMS